MIWAAEISANGVPNKKKHFTQMIYIYCSTALGNYFYPDLCLYNWGSNYSTWVKYDGTIFHLYLH